MTAIEVVGLLRDGEVSRLDARRLGAAHRGRGWGRGGVAYVVFRPGT